MFKIQLVPVPVYKVKCVFPKQLFPIILKCHKICEMYWNTINHIDMIVKGMWNQRIQREKPL